MNVKISNSGSNYIPGVFMVSSEGDITAAEQTYYSNVTSHVYSFPYKQSTAVSGKVKVVWDNTGYQIPDQGSVTVEITFA